MSARQAHVPGYRLHKQSGQAVVTLPDGNGQRRDVLLGKHGTKESKTEYRRVVLEWEANDRRMPTAEASEFTVAELIARYWKHVAEYYRRADGTKTHEVVCMMYALRPLNYLRGESCVMDFGPAALKAVRELMVNGYDHPNFGPQAPLARTEINKRVKRIRRMLKWGVENELVPPAVLVALQAVAPLKRGRTKAHESDTVKPIARAVVEETLPLLRPMMRDMVTLQLETGMRPGELVAMRAIDIDMSSKVWIYKPPQHKTVHHGHERGIAIGPRGQEIVKRHLGMDVEALLFTPRALMGERAQSMRANRKTPVQPSQERRRKTRPKKSPGGRYTTLSYGRAIAEAIKRHNDGKPDGENIPHWAPNQLRHLRALELKRQFGLDVARAVLGHRQPCITEHYAGVDQATAAEVMGKIG